MSVNSEDELLSLLTSDIDPKLKVSALENILGLTVTEDGIAFLLKSDKFLKTLASLLNSDSEALVNKALKCFVNISGFDSAISKLLDKDIDLATKLLGTITRCEESSLTSTAIMTLSNITRKDEACETLLAKCDDFGGLEKLIHLLCTGTPHSSYDHVASVVANLTQLKNGRQLLMDQKDPLIKRLLPFTTYKESETRRLGVVGAIRNCCFDTDYHELLLDDTLNLLPALLLPLAGPEEFDEDEMEKLPLDLQYLEENKDRDSSPEIRRMLLEALTQLCAKKEGRREMRDKNVYVILRELHNWEKVPAVVVACENLVDILIGEEPQPGMENLREVEIPSELVEKFQLVDQELLEIS